MQHCARRFPALAVLLSVAVACGAAPSANLSEDGGDYVESSDGAPSLHDAAGPLDSGSGGSSSGGSGSGGSGSGGSSSGGSGGSGSGSGGSGDGGSGGGSDGGSSGGGPITCPGPGNPANNGGSCGTERWSVKTGTDSQASSVSLVAKPTTIAALGALPAQGGGSSRSAPTETTLWELRDVTLSMIKEESDSDYHMVLSDGSHTLIAEIPSPTCTSGSAWSCFISRARSTVDAKYNVTGSFQYPAATVTVRGVGFFDIPHGQTGVAPNAIELHPVLQVCFGQGCTPN